MTFQLKHRRRHSFFKGWRINFRAHKNSGHLESCAKTQKVAYTSPGVGKRGRIKGLFQGSPFFSPKKRAVFTFHGLHTASRRALLISAFQTMHTCLKGCVNTCMPKPGLWCAFFCLSRHDFWWNSFRTQFVTLEVGKVAHIGHILGHTRPHAPKRHLWHPPFA